MVKIKGDLTKFLESREKRERQADTIVQSAGVRFLDKDRGFSVKSGMAYRVHRGTCTCPDHENRMGIHGGRCKHVIAVERFLYQQIQERATDLAGLALSSEDHMLVYSRIFRRYKGKLNAIVNHE